MIDLDPALVIALSKTLAKLPAELPPGIHPIYETITLHIAGSVKRAEDGEYTPPVDVPMIDLLACCLEKAGCGRHVAKDVLASALANMPEYTPRNPDRIKDVRDALDGWKTARKAEQPTKTRAGAVTAQVVVEVVRPATLAA